jgi:glycosyltransferase involved in cell wall biosynthesis
MMTSSDTAVDNAAGANANAPGAVARAGALPIYVEVSALMGRHVTGIGRWVALLIEALLRIRPLRLIRIIQGEYALSMGMSKVLKCGHEIALPQGCMPDADRDLPAWARQLFRRPPRPLDNRLMTHCGVVYPFLRPPQRRFAREFSVIHDCTPALMPRYHVAETRQKFGELFVQHATLCDKLIADSESTRSDCRWITAMPPDKLVVLGPGPSMCVRRHASAAPMNRQTNLFLIVSTLEPRKNGAFLLRWFLNTTVLPADARLWWVGPEGWLLKTSARRLGNGLRAKQIRFLGKVSDSRLCELYRRASVTIYPSLYEGFGFPVLDSLRHGTPVLCGYNSSLAEFAGPGVHYFDAADPASLDQAYRELRATSSGAVERSDLDRRLNWDNMARMIASLCSEPETHGLGAPQRLSVA